MQSAPHYSSTLLTSRPSKSRLEQRSWHARIEDGGDNFAQKLPEPSEDQAQVVADGAEEGVCAIALASVQEVSIQVAVRLGVADHGLDC